jgi:hypothetical protein
MHILSKELIGNIMKIPPKEEENESQIGKLANNLNRLYTKKDNKP